jgi:hypothetical protein
MKISKLITFPTLLIPLIFIGCNQHNNKISPESPNVETKVDEMIKIPVENKNPELNANTEEATDIEVINTPNSNIEIESIDENWMLYKNYNLSFKLKYPKTNFNNPESNNMSESGNMTILLHDSYSRKQFEKQKNAISDFDKARGLTFAFISHPAKDDDAIKTFIQNKYGKNCTSFKKVPSKQKGSFDIIVENTAKSLDDTSGCIINYATYTKYSPKFKRIISWDGGQDCTLIDANKRCIVNEVIDSFEFLE